MRRLRRRKHEWAEGWADGDGCQYIYCLPPATSAGGRIRLKVIKCAAYGVASMNGRRGGRTDGCQYIYCLPSAGGRIRSQGNKMRRLRRRKHEWFMKLMK
jgi:hypothetical protein